MVYTYRIIQGKHTVRPIDAYTEYNFNIPVVFVEIFPKSAVLLSVEVSRLMVRFRGMNLGVRRPTGYTLEETNMEAENRRMLTSSKPIRFYVHLWGGGCRFYHLKNHLFIIMFETDV